MARAFILAKQKKAVGIFTNKKNLWTAMHEAEKSTPPEDDKEFQAQPLAGLVLVNDDDAKPCNYQRLCTALRKSYRVAVYSETEKNEAGEAVLEYAVFEFEMNKLTQEGDTDEDDSGD